MDTTIEAHAKVKGMVKPYLVAILFRTPDGKNCEYREQPLRVWSCLRGHYDSRCGQEIIFIWYRNQKQQFNTWKVPMLIFFTVEPVRTVTFTESEFEQGHKNWYRQGYENGREGKPKKSLK